MWKRGKTLIYKDNFKKIDAILVRQLNQFKGN